jgi:hypothetical protein
MQHIPPARKHLAQGRHLPELWQLAATPNSFPCSRSSKIHIITLIWLKGLPPRRTRNKLNFGTYSERSGKATSRAFVDSSVTT